MKIDASLNRWGLKQNTSMKSNTLSHENKPAGLAVILAVGLAGLLVLPSTATDMDGAEFALIASRGGIAHPPGYPLYSAMLRGWHEAFGQWFASETDVTSPPILALMSVIAAMATAWLIWAAIITWQNRPGAQNRTDATSPWLAAAATLAVMLATPVWRASTGLEPFALNDLMAASLMLLAAQGMTSSTPLTERHAALTGLLFGLAFCNHHSLAFGVPLALPLLTRGQLRPMFRGAAVGFIAGLTPMIWFVTERHNHAGFIWGDWSDFLARLLTHIFRTDYGTLNLKSSPDGTWLSGPIFMIKTYATSLSWIWTIPVVIGIIGTSLKARKFEWLCLASFATTGVAMPILFRTAPTVDGSEVMARFAALPLLLLAPAIASGLCMMRSRVKPQWHRAAAGILVIAIGLHAAAQLQASNRRFETLTDTHLNASLRALIPTLREPGRRTTWIVTTSDQDFFGFTYKIAAMTPKPVIVQTGLWPSLWYRRQTLQQLGASGVEIQEQVQRMLLGVLPTADAFDLLTQMMTTSKSKDGIFLSSGTFPGMADVSHESYPFGSFIRLSATNESDLPPHRQIVQINTLFTQPVLEALAGGSGRTSWERYALEGWRRTWTALAMTSQNQGDQRSLTICIAILSQLGPASSDGSRQIP